jgi:hypothetical protein
MLSWEQKHTADKQSTLDFTFETPLKKKILYSHHIQQSFYIIDTSEVFLLTTEKIRKTIL